jgi:hypothetical protein
MVSPAAIVRRWEKRSRVGHICHRRFPSGSFIGWVFSFSSETQVIWKITVPNWCPCRVRTPVKRYHTLPVDIVFKCSEKTIHWYPLVLQPFRCSSSIHRAAQLTRHCWYSVGSKSTEVFTPQYRGSCDILEKKPTHMRTHFAINISSHGIVARYCQKGSVEKIVWEERLNRERVCREVSI